MVHEPVEEMPVVGYDDECTAEFLQILFQYVEGDDVEIVRRLVHHQEVRLLHQYGEKVEPALFASAESADLAVEHIVREQETSEKGRVIDYLQNGVVRVEFHSALSVISYFQGFSPLYFPVKPSFAAFP